MTWAFVPTSGAGMSRVGPSTFSTFDRNEREIDCSSAWFTNCGSTLIPPLAPPKGMPAMAVFQVISSARARTSSRSTSGWKRIPPL